MKKLNMLTTVAIAALAISITACSSENKDSKEQAEEVNDQKLDDRSEKDADRIVEIYCSNLYEIRTSENAAMRGTITDVKKLAGMMVTAHTKMNADLQALAGRKNITLPADITEKQQKDLQDLTETNGLNYDKEYTQQLKNMHENAVKLLERTSDKTEDAEIKQWVSSVLPEVRSHLEMVEATLKNVKEVKKEDHQEKKEKNTWEGKSGITDGKDDIHDDKKHGH